MAGVKARRVFCYMFMKADSVDLLRGEGEYILVIKDKKQALEVHISDEVFEEIASNVSVAWTVHHQVKKAPAKKKIKKAKKKK